MPLVEVEDFRARSRSAPERSVAELVRQRVHDDARRMPPPPNAKLAADELAILDRWLDEGAPPGQGGAACTRSAPTRPEAKPLSCSPDQFIRPSTKVTIPRKTDPYMCFGVDIDVQEKRHVIALRPFIDNTKFVHHILLFQSPRSYPSEPVECPVTGNGDWKLVSGWAPGMGPLELPKQAGFPEEGTTHWVLQVHYNNPEALEGQTDGSGYDLCSTTELRPNDADVFAAGSVDFSIPPRSRYGVNCFYRWGAGFYGDGRDQHSKINIFYANPHMHGLGRKMTVHRLTSGIRRREAIFEETAYDYNSQYFLATDVDVEPGDLLQTRCEWENAGGQAVGWGEGTQDEMCFAFLMYYPRVSGDLWNWAVPSAGKGTNCYDELAP